MMVVIIKKGEIIKLTSFDDEVYIFNTSGETIIMCIKGHKCNKEEAYTYAQKRKKK